MTEGVLGKRSYTLPQGIVVGTARQSKILARRYASARRRAYAITRAHKISSWFVHLWVVAGAFLMPMRYGVATAVFASAALFLLAGAVIKRGAAQVKWQFEEALPAKLKRIHIKDIKQLNTALIFGTFAIVFFLVSFYSVGLEVIMDGESIGYISNQRVFEKAVKNVSEKASQILGTPYVLNSGAKYHFSIVRRNVIFNSSEVEERLFGEISELKNMYVLTINGETIGASENYNNINGPLTDLLGTHRLTSLYDTVSFAQDVQISYQLTAAALEHDRQFFEDILSTPVRESVSHIIEDGETIEEVSANYGISEDDLLGLNPDLESFETGSAVLISRALPYLSIVSTQRISYVEEVPFQTEYQDDSQMFVGETKVLVSGVNGQVRVFADVSYTDDVLSGKNVIEKVTLSDATSAVVARGTVERKSTGTFIRPYHGVLSSNYGNRYIFGRVEFHPAIDLAGPKGSPIKASDGGVVVFAGVKSGYGNVVIIDHQNGYKTLYAHCSKLLVTAGQEVGQGEKIALIGSTGRSTGPHVHFEIQTNGSTVNPLKYLLD